MLTYAKTERRRIVFLVRFCVLASGSGSNSAFLATSKTRILIDAGLSVRGIDAEDSPRSGKNQGICCQTPFLITHERFRSHFRGCPGWSAGRAKKKKPLPVFVSKSDIAADRLGCTEGSGFSSCGVEQFQAGSGWMIGNIVIQSATIPHDAVDPVRILLPRGRRSRSESQPIWSYMPGRSRSTCGACRCCLLESESRSGNAER